MEKIQSFAIPGGGGSARIVKKPYYFFGKVFFSESMQNHPWTSKTHLLCYTITVIGRPHHSQQVARGGGLFVDIPSVLLKNDDEYQCKINMQHLYRFPCQQISSLDSSLAAIKKQFTFEQLLFQSKSTILINFIC